MSDQFCVWSDIMEDQRQKLIIVSGIVHIYIFQHMTDCSIGIQYTILSRCMHSSCYGLS